MLAAHVARSTKIHLRAFKNITAGYAWSFPRTSPSGNLLKSQVTYPLHLSGYHSLTIPLSLQVVGSLHEPFPKFQGPLTCPSQRPMTSTGDNNYTQILSA